MPVAKKRQFKNRKKNFILFFYKEVIYIHTRYIIDTFSVVGVPCSVKGVCADPRSGDATFGGGGARAPNNGQGASVESGQGRREDVENGWKQGGRPHHGFKRRLCTECHCALYNNSVTHPLQELYLIVLLFQENKSFGASTVCIHPLM